MSKQLFILLGVLSIQIHASYGVEDSNVDTKAEIEEEIKLDDIPYGIADGIGNTKDTVGEGTRQKRFYDYLGYGTGASTFSSVYSSIPSSDIPYSTNVPNEQNKLNEILTILQKLAEITRPRYAPPINHHTAPYPVFIPFNYIAQSGCTCTQSNAYNPTTATPPASQTTKQPPATNYIPPSTNKPGNNTMPNLPDLGSRVGEESTKDPVSGDEDGVRPINFIPIPPKVPQTVKSPPVEHGSFQAGLDPIPPVYNPPRDTANNRPLENNNMETIPQKAPMPSICEGAILTCCHRAIVENKCFAQEGCGELDYKNPCDTAVLSSIVTKFRAYFKQRG